MKSLLNYLGSCLSIQQLKDILEILAVNAFETTNYFQSERYRET